jgi:hypothetical protein
MVATVSGKLCYRSQPPIIVLNYVGGVSALLPLFKAEACLYKNIAGPIFSFLIFTVQ